MEEQPTPMRSIPRTLPLLLGLLALLPVFIARPTPALAMTVGACNGPNCVNLTATMADGHELRTPVKPADDADEPDEDEVVHLVATTNANLAANNWRLQIVDLNGNLYANCGTNTFCQVFVWNDEEGQLSYQYSFVPDQKTVPLRPVLVPYGADGHTVQFAARIVDAWNRIVTQASVGILFKEGLEHEH
jgi:hypothetical protein